VSSNFTLTKNYLMKLFISIFFFLTFLFSFGQKKDIYVNEDLNEIVKKDFNKINVSDGYLKLKFEVDSVFVNVNVKRIKKGKIATNLLDSIKLNLSSDINFFSENDFFVINYYPGKDQCNSSGNKDFVKEKYRNFIREIKKNKQVKQFFVCKDVEGTETYGKINWINDKNAIIEKTFFPLHYPCGSFVLIDSLGNFYSYKGEYNIDNIHNLLKDSKTFIISD
jgi:hypothetical protein